MRLISTSGLSADAGGRTLFRDINLDIESKKILAVTGPNGTGKTTLLRILHRLASPSSGSITYWREPLRVAMVFQRPLMLATTVHENVAYPLKQLGIASSERRTRINRILAEAGLSHLSERVATRLSGGEQQRVAMARALAIEPEVLLLDEPTAHLDARSTAMTESWLRERRSRMGIVLVSHDPKQVERIADFEHHLGSSPASQLSTISLTAPLHPLHAP